MSRYVVEGKLRKTEFGGFFVETETDEKLLPLGIYLDDILGKIPQHAEVTIVIDYKIK